MNSCVFTFTGKRSKGRFLHRCIKCGTQRRSAYPDASQLHAKCKVAGEAPAPQRRRKTVPRGPGTELSRLVAELGIKKRKNCGCGKLARLMNQWGVERCQGVYRLDILAAMEQNYQTLTWAETATAAWRGVWILNPLDPAGSLLDEACRRANAPVPAYVNLDRIGWGDLAIFAWIALGTRDTLRPLVICATGERARHVRLLGLEPEADVTKDGQEWQAFTEEMEYLHAGGTEGRLEFYADYYDVPRLFQKPALQIPAADREFARSLGIDRKTVLFFPDSLAPNRVWPKIYWNDLAELLAQRGLRSLAFPIHGFEQHSNAVEARPLVRVAACMELAGLAVGNDSALINWTPLVDLPALCLLGPTRSEIFQHAPLIRCVTPRTPLPYNAIGSEPAGADCNGCCYHFKHNPFCSQTCMSLANLLPAEVADAAIEYHQEVWG